MITHFAPFARTVIVLLCVALCGTAVAQTASTETKLRNLEGEAEFRRSLDDYMHLLRTRDWDNYIKLFATEPAIDIVEGIRKVDWDLLAGAGRAAAPAPPASKPAK
jgi:hypothetical protein